MEIKVFKHCQSSAGKSSYTTSLVHQRKRKQSDIHQKQMDWKETNCAPEVSLAAGELGLVLVDEMEDGVELAFEEDT
jgi:hypothetical protein